MSIPIIDTASLVFGIISPTKFIKTVRDSNIVTPKHHPIIDMARHVFFSIKIYIINSFPIDLLKQYPYMITNVSVEGKAKLFKLKIRLKVLYIESSEAVHQSSLCEV